MTADPETSTTNSRQSPQDDLAHGYVSSDVSVVTHSMYCKPCIVKDSCVKSPESTSTALPIPALTSQILQGDEARRHEVTKQGYLRFSYLTAKRLFGSSPLFRCFTDLLRAESDILALHRTWLLLGSVRGPGPGPAGSTSGIRWGRWMEA